jgi:muramoyltetrapeptide carboxypeptidase
MIFPPSLKTASTIALVAPSGRINLEIIPHTCNYLQALGYNVIVGNNASGNFFQFSGTDSERIADLQQMLDSPDIDAIWCLRGGYGLIRIIDKLNFKQFIKHPKLLLGFSDITVLHACLNNQLQVSSIHCSMAKYLLESPINNDDIQNTLRLLKGELPNYQLSTNPLNRTGESIGMMTGGNLSLLYALRGTPYDFDPTGKILFIEDLSEYLYHLDRMMHNLRLGGILERISGLVVGQFTEMKDNDTPFGQSAYGIIRSAVDSYDYPVLFDFPAGHATPNYPLILGQKATLKVTQTSCSLTY